MGSASKSTLNKRKLTCFKIPEKVERYVDENNLPFRGQTRYVNVFLIYHMLVILAQGEYHTDSAKVLRKKSRQNLCYALTSSQVSIKEKIYIIMAAITPKLFCCAYRKKYRRRK